MQASLSPVFPRWACLAPGGPRLAAALVTADPKTTAPGVSSSLEFGPRAPTAGLLRSSCAFLLASLFCSKHRESYQKTLYSGPGQLGAPVEKPCSSFAALEDASGC